MNLADLTLSELRDLRQKIDKELDVRRIQEKEKLRLRFLEAAEAAGFTIDEVLGKQAGGRKQVKIKYRDPENPSNTWAGRGRKPSWLVKALEEGRSLEEFEI